MSHETVKMWEEEQRNKVTVKEEEEFLKLQLAEQVMELFETIIKLKNI